MALAVTELCGLSSPGRSAALVDRLPRRDGRSWPGWSASPPAPLVAGVSPGVVVFAAGLFLLALAKIVFDVGLGTWIADHVPYERRGRVVGTDRDVVGARPARRRQRAGARDRGVVVAVAATWSGPSPSS